MRWSGLAVFKREQMVGTLTTDETCKFMQIQKHKGGGTITFPYDDNSEQLVTISLEYIKSKDTISYENGRVVARKSIFLEGKLLEKTFDSDLSTPQAIKEIESDAEQYLNHTAARMVSKLQNDYSSDILGLGSKIRSYQPKIWEQLEWRKHDFSEADIQITYIMKIRNNGMEMK
ncbi:Spore germination protein B3 precursor [compost metagenome]